MAENEIQGKSTAGERILCVLFLLVLLSIPAADRVLYGINSTHSLLQTGRPDFPKHPFKVNADNVESSYGDLTKMLADPWLRHKYGVIRKNHIKTDMFGFAVARGITPENANVVVAGDSYTTAGLTADDMLAGRISSADSLGLRAYNIGFPGNTVNSGLAFLRMYKPGLDGHNAGKHLIFVICKRNLTNEAVKDISMVYGYSPRQMQLRLMKKKIYRCLPHFFLRQFNDQSVLVNYANAIVYYFSHKFERIARNAEDSVTAGDTNTSDSVVIGKKGTLFFAPEVAFWEKTGDTTSIESFSKTMEFMKKEAADRGFDFLLVMVPDKSDVYPELLPEKLRPPSEDPVAEYFSEIQRSVSGRGVRVQNLLPVMRRKARQCNCMLYYKDDTHWNARGKQIVVQRIIDDIISPEGLGDK